MNIKIIVDSELHTVASADLDVTNDLLKEDASLQEAINAHEKSNQETEKT